MVKVLFMVFHFPPISGGGVVVIVELANSLAKLGHDVTILTPKLKWDGPIYNPELHSKIKIIKIDTPSESNLKIAARRCFSNMEKSGIEIGKENKFDFILTIFHPFHFVPRAAVSCSKKLKIPVIIKIDDAIYAKSKGLKSLQRKIEKIYNTKTLKNSTKILVSNEITKNIINNYYHIPIKNISIVPNGVDTSKYYTQNKISHKIIFSGAMYHHRGLDILLNAAQKIIKINPKIKFILFGSGPELEKLKEFTQKNDLNQNVKFEGWVDRNKIPDYLSEANIGIGPLRSTEVTNGALPIKVLEYMASSLPIIAIKNTLPEDILEDGKNGFFVKDENELIEKILFLASNENMRKEMGEKSKEMIQKFDWNNVSKSIIDEFKKIS